MKFENKAQVEQQEKNTTVHMYSAALEFVT